MSGCLNERCVGCQGFGGHKYESDKGVCLVCTLGCVPEYG